MSQPSMLTRRVIFDGLRYILGGRLRIKNAHLPVSSHIIPPNFMGVCVASNENPAVDTYIIEQLNTLGIKEVRLDFSYGDLTSFNTRFLHALIAHDFHVSLHIVQPFAAAQSMQMVAEQVIWREFLTDVLKAFGSQIKQLEIGTTINRKRWAGYTLAGFLHAWEIAQTLAQAHSVTLVGPNIQDFEPVYNISLLKTLQLKQQLPTIQSNNLFCERVTEPERFDHRIFKYQWATFFKYNLIKKARLLQKIGADFGVSNFISPVAFWAIYRIQRLLPDGAQKQADYLARYFILLASSASLQQANWGAFICQREGLIDDGLAENNYPDLERVTFYKNADGALSNYHPRPSFYAFKTVAQHIQGAKYIGPIASAKGLEIHYFERDDLQFHAAWTINGKAALLDTIYDSATLQASQIIHRDGELLINKPDLITESPIYLRWDKAFKITLESNPTLADNLTIHAHVKNLHYYQFNDGDWQGLVLAESAENAHVLMQNLHPETLQAPNKNGALRHARNAIWTVPNPIKPSSQLTVKQPIKMYPHKAFLDRFKPSKAKRSWNGAMELMRRGVNTAQPVAFFEKIADTSLKQNFYICVFVQADANIGQIFSAYARGEHDYLGLNPEAVYAQLANYCHTMHSRGVHFRDLSGGNILVNIDAKKQLTFSLIDTARIHSYNHGIAFNLRIDDLTRVCNKLDWLGRERFMQIYCGLTGRQFTWENRLQFQLYDLKVSVKRTIGRKAIKRLMQSIKAKT